MSRHKLHPAPPPRCIHVYAQGWSCPRPVERDNWCRVHHPDPPQLTLVASAPETKPVLEDKHVVGLDVAVDETARVDLTGDERSAIALLALFVERTANAEVEGVPLAHAVTLARGFLKHTRRTV